MTNSKRIHVYLRQRYGDHVPTGRAEDRDSRLTPKQRRRAARKGFREEVQAA